MTDTGGWPEGGLEAIGHCPACGADARRLLHDGLVDQNFGGAPGRWTSWMCRRCRTAYLDPRPTPPTIALAYRAYYTHGNPRAAPVTRLEALFLDHAVSSAGTRRVLDVGSGAAGFLLRAAERGWQTEGVEPDAAAVQRARAHGATVIEGSVEALGGRVYDEVVMNHSIEHVHDPVAVLDTCRRALRPGGSVWIATPHFGGLGCRLFGPWWYGLDPPRHLAVMTRAGLEAALRRAGFGHLEWRPGVGLSEAFARVRRAAASRTRRATENPPPTGSDLVPEKPSPGPSSRRAVVARHPATNAFLRLVELGLPATADELIVRARPR